MNALKISLLCACVTALFATSSTSWADEPCVKRVFNHYCLGGEAPQTAQQDADTLLIEDARGDVELSLQDGIITAVSRAISPADWLRYTDLKVKLVRLYGTATDASSFPRSATSRSSRLNSIRAGRGYAATYWDQPGWRVALDWRELDQMQLRYELAADTPALSPTDDALEGL